MNKLNNKVIELITEQESYRDDLYLYLKQSYNGDDKSLYDVTEILLKINLITNNIYGMGIDDEQFDLYCDYVYYLKKERYLKCKDIYEKIINYNVSVKR